MPLLSEHQGQPGGVQRSHGHLSAGTEALQVPGMPLQVHKIIKCYWTLCYMFLSACLKIPPIPLRFFKTLQQLRKTSFSLFKIMNYFFFLYIMSIFKLQRM